MLVFDVYRHGWCGTTRHVITGKPGSHLKPDAEISSRAGWGVCSETCDETYREVNSPQSTPSHTEKYLIYNFVKTMLVVRATLAIIQGLSSLLVLESNC